VRFHKRVVGALSRRLHRPELLAAVDARARQAQRDELAIAAILAAALHSDATYIDVGTNRGQILAAAVRIAPAGRHVAFEPIPALADELAAAFPQVDCRRMALGARKEIDEFCHFTLLDGWSGLRRHPSIGDQQGAPEFIDVQVSTLDDEVGKMAPRVIKIDVEGAELAVLQGGRSLLAAARPIVIFEHVPDAAELYGDEPAAAWDLFTELGFRVFAATGEGPFTRSRFSSEHGIVNWLATPDG
jgi:FkbM family methyltransferase